MTKPTSKVIQISTGQYCIAALCEDGSIWHQSMGDVSWSCALEANNV